ncbi:MAG: ferrous iron transport protein B [Thermotogaceae bacterium]|nr:ferrous iron transport protein B [Thermotogaceae bacterium]
MANVVALVGNPNVGKSSLFNAITGSRQYVANWPGVTVSRREGIRRWRGNEIKFVDLPGIYSLGAISLDEKITREYIMKEAPDVVVVVVDSLNMEQGLYLLIEVLEMREDIILVVNAIDEARKRGVFINKYELEKHFGVHTVLTSAVTGEGITELLDKILHVLRSKEVHSLVQIRYSEEIEREIRRIVKEIEKTEKLKSYKERWLAVKYLEGDEEVLKLLKDTINLDPMDGEKYEHFRSKIAKRRYEYIDTVLKEAVSTKMQKMTFSEAIDHVMTHRFLGIPIFLSMMYLTFRFTFDVMAPFSDLIDAGMGKLADIVRNIAGDGWVSSLIADGIIGGVGAVLVFVPNIFGMFLALGFLEEFGYLPRAAFVIDRIMYRLKLSGRAFMSLILGFGCNVPSIMSTRGISDPRERLITILVSPFITCSARLPVYLLIVGTIFKGIETAMIFIIYISSMLLTAVSALFWNRVLFKGEPVPLIMELPRYRIPTFKNLSLYVWERGKHFLEKAGGIILISSIVIWFLGYMPNHGDIEHSYAAALGKFLSPVFAPLHFNWRMVTALIFGTAAKEVVVSTLSMLYGGSGANLALGLAHDFNIVTALAFIFFVMAYVPCFATIATTASESGSWKWAAISVIYSLSVAYIIALVITLIGGMFA